MALEFMEKKMEEELTENHCPVQAKTQFMQVRWDPDLYTSILGVS
jgi:hypothetical protein